MIKLYYLQDYIIDDNVVLDNLINNTINNCAIDTTFHVCHCKWIPASAFHREQPGLVNSQIIQPPNPLINQYTLICLYVKQLYS